MSINTVQVALYPKTHKLVNQKQYRNENGLTQDCSSVSSGICLSVVSDPRRTSLSFASTMSIRNLTIQADNLSTIALHYAHNQLGAEGSRAPVV